MKNLLAQQCSTYSKRADQHVYNWPQYFDELTTEHYMDTVCGLGSNLIGYQNNFSCHRVEELILAEKLLALIPFCDRVKFLKTGSAACEAAIRIARAYTGRVKTVGNGYHGCSNVFIAEELPGLGCFYEGYNKYANEELIEKIDRKTGAVIIEPVQLDYSESHKKFVIAVAEKCQSVGAMLIFDEIITGFRVPNFFVSNDWGIQPDIICGGKALGNGYPISFVAGKAEWMDKEYFISNTHNGELSGIENALETIDSVSRSSLDHVWQFAGDFQNSINGIVSSIEIIIKGYPTRGEWQGNAENHAKFCEIMADNGILVGKAWFFNFEWEQKETERFLTKARAAVDKIKAGYELKGYIPMPIFRRNA